MLVLDSGPLSIASVHAKITEIAVDKNYGANATFTGIVRSEGGIEALSFDIYEPLLTAWFNSWQDRAAKEGAYLVMAHSIGNVPVGSSSYISAVLSSQRRVCLELFPLFVEDFKKNAPIWKYDVIASRRIYALERSHALPSAGLLG